MTAASSSRETRSGSVLSRVVIHTLLGALLLSIAGAAMLGIGMLALGNDSVALGRWLGTLIVFAAASGLSLAGSAVARRGTLPLVGWTAMPLSYAAFTGWSAVIWWEDSLLNNEMELLVKLSLMLTIASFGFVYTAAFNNLPTRHKWLHLLRWIVIVDAWVFGLITISFFWIVEYSGRGAVTGSWLIFTMLMILTGPPALIGSLALPGVMRRMSQQRAAPESINQRLTIEMTCPRCETSMSGRTGPVRCPACKLSMLIDVEEPRCECGYLLFRLTGDHCPECGRSVPVTHRWSPPQETRQVIADTIG